MIATCNDISQLPPEFSRSERFDGIFFVDLPGVAQKRTIWRMYIEKFGLDATQPKPVDADWTGAEIRACCRLAALLGRAAGGGGPERRARGPHGLRVGRAAADMGSGRCLSADQPGIYSPNANAVDW